MRWYNNEVTLTTLSNLGPGDKDVVQTFDKPPGNAAHSLVANDTGKSSLSTKHGFVSSFGLSGSIFRPCLFGPKLGTADDVFTYCTPQDPLVERMHGAPMAATSISPVRGKSGKLQLCQILCMDDTTLLMGPLIASYSCSRTSIVLDSCCVCGRLRGTRWNDEDEASWILWQKSARVLTALSRHPLILSKPSLKVS
jgi:hypothetical protein